MIQLSHVSRVPQVRYCRGMKSPRIAAAVVAASLATLGSLFAFTPSAAAAVYNCPNAQLCLFNNINFQTNEGAEFTSPRSAGTCEAVAFPNAISSVKNNSGRTARLYDNAGCSGDYVTYANGAENSRMSIQRPTHENDFESVQWR